MDKTDKKSMELKIDNGELKTSMIPEDFTDPQILYDKLIAMIKRYHPSGDISQIEKAYKIAYKAHDGQLRKSGEPYIIHPVCVCIILAELELDKETIVAGMLHDVVEDTVMTSEEIAAEFGDEVALLVMFIYLGNYLLDKFLSPAPALIYPLNKVIIYIRLKIFESKIIKFNFNFRNTKSVCDRCIDIECLP